MTDNNRNKMQKTSEPDQELKKAAEGGDDNNNGKRSKQGMIDRATEPDWYGVTSF